MKSKEFILEKRICLTPEVQYHFSIIGKKLSVTVSFPKTLELSEKEAKDVELATHIALEAVLAPYWHQLKD
jgi:hypothetical protein